MFVHRISVAVNAMHGISAPELSDLLLSKCVSAGDAPPIKFTRPVGFKGALHAPNHCFGLWLQVL